MYNYNVKIRVTLEGVDIPFTQLNITYQVNIPTVGTLVIPYVESARNIEYGTILTIFYTMPDNKEYIYFEGEVTGVSYQKQKMNKSIRIFFADARTYLNTMPVKYLEIFSDSEKFRILDGNIAKRTQEVEFIIDHADFYGLNEEALGELVKNIVAPIGSLGVSVGGDLRTYFMGMIKLLQDAKEPYYNNNERRYTLFNSNTVYDCGAFAKIVDASDRENAVMQHFSNVVRKNTATLDTLLSELSAHGFIYVSIPSPSAIHNKFINSFILMNDPFGFIPPPCNMIAVNNNDSLSVNINPPQVTAIMNNYMPPDKINDAKYGLASKRSPATNTDNGYCGEEVYGIRREVIEKSYYYNRFLAGKDVKNKDVQEFLQQSTDYDFIRKQYKSRTFRLSKSSFIPTFIAGMPILLYDIDANEYFYATSNTYSLSVDAENGNISTEISGDSVYCLGDKVKVDGNMRISGINANPLMEGFSCEKAYISLGLDMKYDSKDFTDFVKEDDGIKTYDDILKHSATSILGKSITDDSPMELFIKRRPKMTSTDYMYFKQKLRKKDEQGDETSEEENIVRKPNKEIFTGKIESFYYSKEKKEKVEKIKKQIGNKNYAGTL